MNLISQTRPNPKPIRLGLPDHSAPRFTSLETEAAGELIELSEKLTRLAESAALEKRLWNKKEVLSTLRDIGTATTVLCRRIDHPMRVNGNTHRGDPVGSAAKGGTPRCTPQDWAASSPPAADAAIDPTGER